MASSYSKALVWSNAQSVQTNYPNLSPQQCEYIARCGCGPMTEPDKSLVLTGYIRGLSLSDSLRSARVGQDSYKVTLVLDSKFKHAIMQAKANRKQQVESTLYRYATGMLKTVKKTYMAMLDEGGMPMVDERGHPVLYLQKKEVTSVPPNSTLIEFFLRHYYPERFGDYKTEAVMPASPDEMEEQLKAVAKKVLKINDAG